MIYLYIYLAGMPLFVFLSELVVKEEKERGEYSHRANYLATFFLAITWPLVVLTFVCLVVIDFLRGRQ